MNDIVVRLSANCFCETPTPPEDIIAAEAELGVVFPDQLKEVWKWSNGSSSDVNGQPIVFLQAREVSEFTYAYRIDHYLPGSVAIGTDGGGYCLCIDFRQGYGKFTYFSVSFGNLDYHSGTVFGTSLDDVLDRLGKGWRSSGYS